MYVLEAYQKLFVLLQSQAYAYPHLVRTLHGLIEQRSEVWRRNT